MIISTISQRETPHRPTCGAMRSHINTQMLREGERGERRIFSRRFNGRCTRIEMQIRVHLISLSVAKNLLCVAFGRRSLPLLLPAAEQSIQRAADAFGGIPCGIPGGIANVAERAGDVLELFVEI